MTMYRVVWEIDFIEADSPREAAEMALVIHRDPDSIATAFDVHEHGGDVVHHIDLSYLEDSETRI